MTNLENSSFPADCQSRNLSPSFPADCQSRPPLSSSIAPDTIRHLQSVQVTLTREHSLETCTLGILRIKTQNLVWTCRTLELPWRNNQKSVSCIPKGRYMCKRVKSNKFGDTFQVCDVPGRVGILFHAGNYPKDTHGCILLGVYCIEQGGSPFLDASKAAMKQFRQLLEGVETFDLVISSSRDLAIS